MRRRLLWISLAIALLVSLYRILSTTPEQSFTIQGPGNCREVVFPVKELPFAIDAAKLGDRDFAVGLDVIYRIDLKDNPPRVQKYEITEADRVAASSNRQGGPGSDSQRPYLGARPDDSEDSITIRGQLLKKSGKRWVGEIVGKAPDGQHFFLTRYDGRPPMDWLKFDNPIGGSYFDFKYPTGARYYFDVYSRVKGKLFTIAGNTGVSDSNRFTAGWYWLDDRTFTIRFFERKSLLFCELG